MNPFKNLKTVLLTVLVMLVAVPIGAFCLGRYTFPVQEASHCDASTVDCKLEESRAIEGCESTAVMLESELRKTSHDLNSCMRHYIDLAKHAEKCQEASTK